MDQGEMPVGGEQVISEAMVTAEQVEEMQTGKYQGVWEWEEIVGEKLDLVQRRLEGRGPILIESHEQPQKLPSGLWFNWFWNYQVF